LRHRDSTADVSRNLQIVKAGKQAPNHDLARTIIEHCALI